LNKAEQILGFITSELVSSEHAEITLDTDLLGERVVDSSALMGMVLWLESTFGISVSIDDLTPKNFGCVRVMVEYVEQSMASSSLGD
jgi:acyl carrier protein